MNLRKWALRILRVAGLAVVSLVLLTFLAVQFQQRLLRWRAERLMADMHQIRLYQSTWADAQKLMHRWGAWGHYDGTCTTAQCVYSIRIDNDPTIADNHPVLLDAFGFMPGWHFGAASARFAVQDGVIQRVAMSAVVDVHNPGPRRNSDTTLIVSTSSRQSLSITSENGGSLGPDEQLEVHPEYKERSPDGCTICMAVRVAYSTHAPPEEIERLTRFDFSCFTRLHSCERIDELFPAAKPWHLYGLPEEDELTGTPPPPKAPHPCTLPVWTLGRDMKDALVVESIDEPAIRSVGDSEESPDGLAVFTETASVRIVEQLWGSSSWPHGTAVRAQSNAGPYVVSLPELPVVLTKGKRFIVFPVEQNTAEGTLSMFHCGILEDTAENRRELARGASMKDHFRGLEIVPSWW
jgi:hypothetical protein